MTLLRIQHPVEDFERWKAAFDSDPLDRRGSGVRSYAVHRGVDRPDDAIIDLEFATVDEARAMLTRLEAMWASAPAGITGPPQTWLLETVERVDLT